MTLSPHAVSAPGKVLLAGGYLVLDRAYTGLVFGLDARLHVTITALDTSQGVSLSEITVSSPQFDEPAWRYSYRQGGQDGGTEVTQLSTAAEQPLSRNPFVETTLRYALSYIAATTGRLDITPATVTILADNDYYTTPKSLSPGERFHNFGVPLAKASKTGLGSSAALVTALTAALLQHYLPADKFDVGSAPDKQRLHNLAQAAHCAAQGKVGSGFDVASAVFGSCIYRRFSPEILSSLPEPGATGFASSLRKTVDGQGIHWDHEIQKDKVAVPRGLRMIMCDVSCGSQTPGMVKKVLAWRKEQPTQADKIWHDLHAANLGLADALQTASSDESKDYSGISKAFACVREQIRLMGDQSGVPIEPPAQTKLIDACCELRGVIGGTVPGAGGFDAIVLLIQDRQDVLDSLDSMFASWSFDGSAGDVSRLGVRQEMDGIRAEDPGAYKP